jgi:HlyD family secretion protein
MLRRKSGRNARITTWHGICNAAADWKQAPDSVLQKVQRVNISRSEASEACMSAQLKPVPPVSLVDGAGQPAEAIVTARRWDLPLARPARFSRRWAIGLGVLVLAAVAAVVATQLSAHKPAMVKATPVQTITVGAIAPAPLSRSLIVNGSLAAWDELPVGTEAGGLAIVQVAVEEGDKVEKGQLLAKLDDSVLKAQYAQAMAAVAQAEAGIRKAEAMSGSANSDVRRAKELTKNGYISGQVAEQRETTLSAAEADVNVARQNLTTAQAVADERAAQLAQTEIRAPTDGTISKRMAKLGNVVSVGEQLFRMIRDNRVELQAEVPEMDMPGLQEGQVATVVLNDGDPRRFQGKIRLIGATVDPQTRIGMVYVALPQDPALKPGMFVHGEIQTGQADVLQVPEQAIVYKDFKPAVFIVDADSRARLRMIETGQRVNGHVEIVSGVTAGERVALAGAGYLKDNDLVRVEAPLVPTAAGAAGGVVR